MVVLGIPNKQYDSRSLDCRNSFLQQDGDDLLNDFCAITACMRLVCSRWKKNHDSHVSVLFPLSLPQLSANRFIGLFPNIQTLSLRRCMASYNDNDSLEYALALWPALTRLDIRTWKLSKHEGSLEVVRKLSSLKELNLEGCNGISAVGVRGLSELSALTSLNLGRHGGIRGSCMQVRWPRHVRCQGFGLYYSCDSLLK